VSEVLKTLQVTNWYKAVVALSGATFFGTIIAGRDIIALISLGVFIIGLGIWKSHRRVVEFGHIQGIGRVKKEDVVFKPNWGGALLMLLGVAVLAFGLGWALGIELSDLRRLAERLRISF
jgi:hypothetical protein